LFFFFHRLLESALLSSSWLGRLLACPTNSSLFFFRQAFLFSNRPLLAFSRKLPVFTLSHAEILFLPSPPLFFPLFFFFSLPLVGDFRPASHFRLLVLRPARVFAPEVLLSEARALFRLTFTPGVAGLLPTPREKCSTVFLRTKTRERRLRVTLIPSPFFFVDDMA